MTIREFRNNVSRKELALWAGTCINILDGEPGFGPRSLVAGIVTNVLGDYNRFTIEDLFRHQDPEQVAENLGTISKELSVIIVSGGTADDETVLKVQGYLTRLYGELVELV
jgi:hypothetical protein